MYICLQRDDKRALQTRFAAYLHTLRLAFSNLVALPHTSALNVACMRLTQKICKGSILLQKIKAPSLVTLLIQKVLIQREALTTRTDLNNVCCQPPNLTENTGLELMPGLSMH